jgi:hypothetical protein
MKTGQAEIENKLISSSKNVLLCWCFKHNFQLKKKLFEQNELKLIQIILKGKKEMWLLMI